jgi:hypothetical protein
MHALEEIVAKKGISVYDLPLGLLENQIQPNYRYDNIKGIIAETLVREWLKGCDELCVPHYDRCSINGYLFNQNGSGIHVKDLYREGNKEETEYDSLVIYDKKIWIVEVKSGKLNGYLHHAPDVIKKARYIFDCGEKEVGLMLFFPFRAYDKDTLKENIDYLKSNIENVVCIDIGPSPWDFWRCASHVYSWNSDRKFENRKLAA